MKSLQDGIYSLKMGAFGARVSLAHVSTLGAPGHLRKSPWPQSMAPTCDRVLNETQHCALGLHRY